MDALEEAGKTLIDMANARGGKDNITVLLARIEAPVDGVVVDDTTQPSMLSIDHDEETRPAGLRAMEDADSDEIGFDDPTSAEDTSRTPDIIDWAEELGGGASSGGRCAARRALSRGRRRSWRLSLDRSVPACF